MKASEAKGNVKKLNNNLFRIFQSIERLSKDGKSVLTYNDLCYLHHIELTFDDVKTLEEYGYCVEIIKQKGVVNKFKISWY